jgi:hypothetical protein
VRQSYVCVGCFMRILSLESRQGGLCDQHFVAVMFLLQFVASVFVVPFSNKNDSRPVWGGGGAVRLGVPSLPAGLLVVF